MTGFTDKALAWDSLAKARQNERERIAEWLRREVSQTRAGSSNEFVFNCLADAIERCDHYSKARA